MMMLAEGSLDISTALTTATSLFNWVISTITDNAILTAVFVVGTLVPVGVSVFKRVKRAAR